MARGRKKNLSIPPTRALLQQRDYRARRAHYVASLEEKCRKLEEENVRLRTELVKAREDPAMSSIIRNTQMVEASHQLMHHLSLAASSLSQFQQLIFEGVPPAVTPTPPPSQSHHNPTTASAQTPVPPDGSSTFIESAEEPESDVQSDGPDCCGGILDCTDLVEPEPSLKARISDLRFSSTDQMYFQEKPL